MADNTSWLKKTGPYGRITLRRSGFQAPAATFNSSLTMQQADVSFKRPPPRKSCLNSLDRKRLFPPAKEKAQPEVRFSVAGRPSVKTNAKLPVKRDTGVSLKHPRLSYLPARQRQSYAPKVLPTKEPTHASVVQPHETPIQVSSTPREPVQSILRSGRRPTTASVALKKVNFDGLEGVEPLQISEILSDIPSKVDASTNTDPTLFPSAMDLNSLPKTLQSMMTLCNTMRAFLQRFDDIRPELVKHAKAPPSVISKPIFLENLEDISEETENVTPVLDAVPCPDGVKRVIVTAPEVIAFVTTPKKDNKVKSPILSGNTPLLQSLHQSEALVDSKSVDSVAEAPLPNWPTPKYAVDITPSQVRRSARLVAAHVPGRFCHKDDGGRCNRNCC